VTGFTKKAKGTIRVRGSPQITLRLPSALFERLATEAYQANRSFAEHVISYIELGIKSNEAG